LAFVDFERILEHGFNQDNHAPKSVLF
jgi:hypothetical protein